VVAELDVQPFGVSVCESTDRVMVTCSTPLRHVVPFVTKSSRLLVYCAASGAAERLIPLDDAYEIPRHSLAVGHCFAVCHGWHKHGKVASTKRERESWTLCHCHPRTPDSVDQNLADSKMVHCSCHLLNKDENIDHTLNV